MTVANISPGHPHDDAYSGSGLEKAPEQAKDKRHVELQGRAHDNLRSPRWKRGA